MLKEFKADLHIHTCLSPCADIEMAPPAIIKQAKARGLDIIGICDHNSAENVLAVKKAGEKEGVYVLAGMEICTSEEVHIMGFFGDENKLNKMQSIVYAHLPGRNDEKKFGKQEIVDEHGALLGKNEKLLIGAVSLTLERIVDFIHGLGGVAIASHIDRQAFGLIGQLGFIPPGLKLDALEVSANCSPEKAADYRNYGLALVRSSDAHFLADIGKAVTPFLLEIPSFTEIARALSGNAGRKVIF